MSLPLPSSSPAAPSLSARFGLRFVCAYLFLYSFPFPLSLVPYVEFAYAWWFGAWNALVMGTAGAFGIDVPALPAGSGDTTYNYVELPLRFGLALGVALVWTFLPRRVSEARWRAWLALHLRYVLAMAMLGYGFAKVFPGQFVAPSPDRLTSTYGESSPMGLLWTFMGASRPYTIFGGALEVLGGVLLLVRVSATLGALVSAGVLANIVAMNFCYDVPVKLYSSHLLLMSVLVLLPDARRLLAATFGKAVPARERFALATTPRGRWSVRAVHALVLLSIAWGQYQGIAATLGRGAEPPTPLAGLWTVEEVRLGGAPLAPEGARDLVRRAYFSGYGTVMWRTVHGGAERQRFALDEAAGTITLTPFGTPSGALEPRTLAYTLADGVLVLREAKPEGELETRLRATPTGPFHLTERGFHWINEFPNNR